MSQNFEKIDEGIKENNDFIPNLEELCDRLNSTFSTGDVEFYTYEDETVVIFGKFGNTVVQKSRYTLEDINIGGVMITYETVPPQMIPMTENYFRCNPKIVSSLFLNSICACGRHVLQDKCAFGNFIENQEDYDGLVKKIRDIHGSPIQH